MTLDFQGRNIVCKHNNEQVTAITLPLFCASDTKQCIGKHRSASPLTGRERNAVTAHVYDTVRVIYRVPITSGTWQSCNQISKPLIPFICGITWSFKVRALVLGPYISRITVLPFQILGKPCYVERLPGRHNDTHKTKY
jgi:hypothetical protein